MHSTLSNVHDTVDSTVGLPSFVECRLLCRPTDQNQDKKVKPIITPIVCVTAEILAYLNL